MAACVTAISIICQSRIQMDIDDGIRGRAMSLWVVVVIGSAAAGAAVLGAMSDLFGIERTLPVIATGALVILGVLALRTRRA